MHTHARTHTHLHSAELNSLPCFCLLHALFLAGADPGGMLSSLAGAFPGGVLSSHFKASVSPTLLSRFARVGQGLQSSSPLVGLSPRAGGRPGLLKSFEGYAPGWGQFYIFRPSHYRSWKSCTLGLG